MRDSNRLAAVAALTMLFAPPRMTQMEKDMLAEFEVQSPNPHGRQRDPGRRRSPNGTASKAKHQERKRAKKARRARIA